MYETVTSLKRTWQRNKQRAEKKHVASKSFRSWIWRHPNKQPCNRPNRPEKNVTRQRMPERNLLMKFWLNKPLVSEPNTCQRKIWREQCHELLQWLLHITMPLTLEWEKWWNTALPSSTWPIQTGFSTRTAQSNTWKEHIGMTRLLVQHLLHHSKGEMLRWEQTKGHSKGTRAWQEIIQSL